VPTVTCTNPACARAVPLPDDTPAGKVFACPGCRQALPPAPGPVTEAPPHRGWPVCALLTVLIGVAHFIAFVSAAGAPQQAAASAAAAAWTLTVYVLAQCVEKSHRDEAPPGGASGR
jgi:hypothetical protein